MADEQSGIEAEYAAIKTVHDALRPLKEEEQQRVINYVTSVLGLAPPNRTSAPAARSPGRDEELDEGDAEAEATTTAVSGASFGSFAELYDAAQPKSQSDKALVAGYWLQQSQGSESFDSFSVNKELKNLGEGVPNITSALDVLKGQKPALVLQLKKSGKSRQARKTYKVTVAGLKNVENMLRG